MGFLNAMLLLGTVSFAVPLGIHLLNRSQFYSVDWAAIHLLDMAAQQNAKKLEWRSLLLLLLRCLIPVVLAFCMARPLLKTTPVGGARGRSTTVLLLDNSFSMQGHTAGADGQLSGWETASASANQIVRKLADQANLAVVAIGGKAKRVGDLFRADPRPVLGAISRLEPQASAADLEAGFRLASETLTESRDPHRQVVLLSDFQRSDWSSSTEAAIRSIKQRWDSLASEPAVHFIASDVPQQPNVSVCLDATTSEVTLPGEPLELHITLHNHGDQPLPSVPLRVAIDGENLLTRNVEIKPQSRSQLVFTVNIEKPGDHLVTATVEDPTTQISADDADSLSIHTLPPREVLMIEQDPQPSLFACETGFLQLALEATSSELEEGRAARIRRVAANQVPGASIAESDVIVLANVTRLPDDAVEAVARRVSEGGTLCVFGGDSLDLRWYEQALGPTSAYPLLPCRYGETVAAKADTATTDGVAAEHIQGGPYADPALAFFDNTQQGGLTAAELTQWRALTPWNDSGSVAPEDEVGADAVLANQSGEPVLVTANVGSGRVLQWSIAADEESGTLPLQPAFVPLMQRLLLLDLSTAKARHPEKRSQESMLAPLTSDERSALAERLGVTFHSSVEDFLSYDTNRQGGREIWRWLLAVVVVLLFAEMLLAGRLTRQGGR